MRHGDAQNSRGELMQLAAQASSIVGGMGIPVALGGYLDFRWGTHYCVLIGIGIGMVVGTVQLLALARRGPKALGQSSGSQHVSRPASNNDEDTDRDAGA